MFEELRSYGVKEFFVKRSEQSSREGTLLLRENICPITPQAESMLTPDNYC
jgi:hypothetical protein